MAIEDYIDFSYWEEDEPYLITCKFCGLSGLEWTCTRGKHNRKQWSLIDMSGKIHCCRPVIKAENEFDNLD